MAVGTNSTVYVADQYNHNHTIRPITSAGSATTLAGSAGNPGSADGVGVAAQFNFPVGVGLDNNGNVYVTESTDSQTGYWLPHDLQGLARQRGDHFGWNTPRTG